MRPIIPIASSNSTTANFSASSLLSQIKSAATDAGFDLCEVTRPSIPESHQQAYGQWLEAGFHADMNYMSRDPHLRKNPSEAYPRVQSVLALGVSYHQGNFPSKPSAVSGRVARYAWGLDYHEVIQERLFIMSEKLKILLGSDCEIIFATDTKPLLERSLALSAGLGFIGKNTVLISTRPTESTVGRFHVGSYLFLSELLLSVDLGVDSSAPSIANGCGSCSRCLTACPTQAFEGPYQLKANRCISYLTIENKGWIDRELRPLMGDWMFGCDVCQEVCPFNARTYDAHWPEFHSENGVGAWLSVSDMLSIPDQAHYKKRFAGTPLLRSKRKGLLRNACVVAGNSRDESLIPALVPLLQDEEPMLRGHALWAIGRLQSAEKFRPLVDQHMKLETDLLVMEECRSLLDS